MLASEGLSRILEALGARGKVHQNGQESWDVTCPCPGHKNDDSRPSGRIFIQGNRVCCWCFATALGHTWKEWKAALGIPDAAWFLGELQPGQYVPRTVISRYAYKNSDGKVLFTVVRTEPKGFWQERPWTLEDGTEITLNGLAEGWYVLDGKSWKYRRDEPLAHEQYVKAGAVERVLYRLEEIEAAPFEDPVYFVEGEKAAEVCAVYGMNATTTSQGASHFSPGQLKPLKGRHVVILPDADPDGLKHACTVAGACMMCLAASVRVVRWKKSEVPPGGDIQDWLRRVGLEGVEERAHRRFFLEPEPFALCDTDDAGNILSPLDLVSP